MGLFKMLKVDLRKKNDENTVTVLNRHTYVGEIDSKVIQGSIDELLSAALAEAGTVGDLEAKIMFKRKQIKDFENENWETSHKIKELESFGFTNTPSTTKVKTDLTTKVENKKKEIHELSKEISRLEAHKANVERYKFRFPGFKYITTELMIDIMKRYNLCLGETFMYSKEIPQHALNKISMVKRHIKTLDNYFLIKEWGRGNNKIFSMRKDRGYGKEIIDSYRITNLKMIAPRDHFTIPTHRLGEDHKEKNLFILDKETRMFNINEEAIRKANEQIRRIKDPIAALEVPGGYIILDAWDEEAKIPEIQNTDMN